MMISDSHWREVMNKNFTQVLLSLWDKKDNENLLYSIMSLLIENKKELEENKKDVEAGKPVLEQNWELTHREITLLYLLNEISNSLKANQVDACDF